MDIKEIGVNLRNWTDSAKGMDYRRALVNGALKDGFQKPLSQLVTVFVTISDPYILTITSQQ